MAKVNGSPFVVDKDRISQQHLRSHRDNPPVDPLDFYDPDAIDETRGFLGRGAMEAEPGDAARLARRRMRDLQRRRRLRFVVARQERLS